MARLNDLTSNKVQERKRQVRTYGTKTDLASSTIDRGNTHWTQGSRVSIDGLLDIDGTATVSGLLSVTGTLNGSGDINLSGSTEITGPLDITGATTIGGSLNVTGPTTLDGVLDIGGNTTITGTLGIQGDTSITGKLDVTGPTAIKGTLGIEGVTTLKNDLNVTSGGKIKAGNLEIEPANGGQINFTGGSLSAGQFGALLNNLTAVELQAPVVRMRATTTEATGQLKVNSTPIKAASQLTPLGIDSNGVICRIG